MGAVLNKIPNQNKTKHIPSNPYLFKRRVYEVRSPCQWLKHCDNGKCPAFLCLNGNFYCVRDDIP
jgi:hypothetical protein